MPIAIGLAALALSYVEVHNDQYVTKLYRTLFTDLKKDMQGGSGPGVSNEEH